MRNIILSVFFSFLIGVSSHAQDWARIKEDLRNVRTKIRENKLPGTIDNDLDRIKGQIPVAEVSNGNPDALDAAVGFNLTAMEAGYGGKILRPSTVFKMVFDLPLRYWRATIFYRLSVLAPNTTVSLVDEVNKITNPHAVRSAVAKLMSGKSLPDDKKSEGYFHDVCLVNNPFQAEVLIAYYQSEAVEEKGSELDRVIQLVQTNEDVREIIDLIDRGEKNPLSRGIKIAEGIRTIIYGGSCEGLFAL